MPILLLILALALIYMPQLWVKYTINRYHKPLPDLPGNGGELAQHLVNKLGLTGVEVVKTEQGDHYDPENKRVALSPATYDNKSLSAIAIAAHEVGHAMQDKVNDPRMRVRTQLAKLAAVVQKFSSLAFILMPFAGILAKIPAVFFALLLAALAGALMVALVQLANLPLEYDASFNQALPILIEGEYITREEVKPVKSILRAAAFTYVAAALTSLLSLRYWLSLLRR